MNTTDLPRLLLVEDNPADVFLVKQAMREEGFDCELQVVEDGEKALKLIDSVDAGEEAPPDLIMLDLSIPRVSGEAVLERLRESSKCAKVAVAVVTSSDSLLDRRKAEALGADEYFRKPTNLQDFMALGKVARRLVAKSRAAI
jgi:DNA-binding response OmpR family regulator